MLHIILLTDLQDRCYSTHIVDEETEIQTLKYFISVYYQANSKALIQCWLELKINLIFPHIPHRLIKGDTMLSQRKGIRQNLQNISYVFDCEPIIFKILFLFLSYIPTRVPPPTSPFAPPPPSLPPIHPSKRESFNGWTISPP